MLTRKIYKIEKTVKFYLKSMLTDGSRVTQLFINNTVYTIWKSKNNTYSVGSLLILTKTYPKTSSIILRMLERLFIMLKYRKVVKMNESIESCEFCIF